MQILTWSLLLAVLAALSLSCTAAPQATITPLGEKEPWGLVYEFQAGDLTGWFAPAYHNHGLVTLKHSGDGENIVQQGWCFLNAEYYLSPNTPRHMAAYEAEHGRGDAYLSRTFPRLTSGAGMTTVEVDGDSIRVHFPDTLCPDDLKIELDLIYRFYADNKIDFTYRVTPKVDVPGFELFSASYVRDRMGKTCVPYRGPKGETVWDRFAKGRAVGRAGSNCYFYVRDDQAADTMQDGRQPLDFKPWKKTYYALPIIAAISDEGYVLAFFIDPKWCAAVGGQHHRADTALDWAIGTDLKKGEPWVVRTRMHYDRMSTDPQENYRRIEVLYKQFLKDIGRDQ